MKKTYYIVDLTIGDWDAISWNNLFITDKKAHATKYCSKANKIIRKYKKHYTRLYEDILNDLDGNHPMLQHLSHISNRRDFVCGTFGHHELEFRSKPL